MPFVNIEPWNSPVDGVSLADSINNTLKKYISLPDGASEAITLWIMHTYGVDMFDFTPRLCIMSPEKRCGKTSLLTLIECLSYQVISVGGITASPMFRSIDKWRPTMLVDEADTFLKGNDDLRCIINNGYVKNGKVARTEVVGKRMEPTFFKCYAPVALAAIGSLPGTITDRGIIITMRRKKQSEKFALLRTREITPITNELQRKCLRFITDNAEAIAKARPNIPDSFNHRAFDIWEPLYAIASIISPEWLAKVRIASTKLVHAQNFDDDTSYAEKLLSDIQKIFNDNGCDWIASTELINLLNEIEGSPWAEWNNKGLSIHSLPRLLIPFGIKPTQSRIGERSRRYMRQDFTDAFERYLSGGTPLYCATVPPDDDLCDMPR